MKYIHNVRCHPWWHLLVLLGVYGTASVASAGVVDPGSELSILDRIINLGLGAVLAVIVVAWKRTDDAAHAKLLAEMEARHTEDLERLLTQRDGRDSQLVGAIDKMTGAVHGLHNMVEQLANIDRLEDRLRRQREALVTPA